jgi:TRAP-type C4-dicarboxylate transport system permease small subunit
VLRQLDQAYYRFERMLVIACCIAMSAVVFLAVVHSRLASDDSAITDLLLYPAKLKLQAEIERVFPALDLPKARVDAALERQLRSRGTVDQGERERLRREIEADLRGPLLKKRAREISIKVDASLSARRAYLNGQVSPVVLGVLLYIVVLFGAHTALRQRQSVRDQAGQGRNAAGQDEPGADVRPPAWAYLLSILAAPVVALLALGQTPQTVLACAAVVLAISGVATLIRSRYRVIWLAVAVTAAIVAFAGLITQVHSRWTIIALTIAVIATAMVKESRPKLRALRRAVLVVVGVLLSVLAYGLVPEGFAWGNEIASKVLLLWAVFVGTSMATYAGSHIMVDFARKLVPASGRRLYEGLSALVAAAFTFLLAYLGYRYVFGSEQSIYAQGSTESLSGIPAWIGVAAIPWGFSTAGLRFFAAAVRAFLGDVPKIVDSHGVGQTRDSGN